MRQRSLRKQDGAPHVDVEHGAVVLDAELVEAPDTLEPGIVDKNVDLGGYPGGRGPPDGLADEMLGAVERAQVRLYRVGLGPVGQRLDRLSQLGSSGCAGWGGVPDDDLGSASARARALWFRGLVRLTFAPWWANFKAMP